MPSLKEGQSFSLLQEHVGQHTTPAWPKEICKILRLLKRFLE